MSNKKSQNDNINSDSLSVVRVVRTDSASEVTEPLRMLPINSVKSWYNDFVKFSKEILKEGLDYGVIPNVDKPSLLKPGAEKLRLVYGLGVEVNLVSSKEDIDKGYLDYTYKATVKTKSGQILAECEGNANSYEPKWRYNWVISNRVPSKDEAERLKNQKLGKWVKQGDSWVWAERRENNDILGMKNTIIKMAQKRAFVGAILIATGASEFFTQDVDEFIDAEIVPQNNQIKEADRRLELLIPILKKLLERGKITQEQFNTACLSYTKARDLINDIKHKTKNDEIVNKEYETDNT